MQTRMSGCCVCQRITFAKKWAIKSNKQHKKRSLFPKIDASIRRTNVKKTADFCGFS